ncbi:hypothetical protein [Asticcacaulis sp. AND118]|uniref:hypothetical protein n=1 Tax=Asticcacaulis sp. AND118 TaxID=2840468 RepID=UPI001CFF6D16|nr:hypothetical protein [Asticcacaulis sp. AND118]UDF04342.1 hypothetical protein LH365_04695 [Asticcacaulis sp. AND118]
MESIKIIGFSIFAAVSYGILHDMVTAHLCVEYFTVAHPPVFATQSPFLLALGWGIIATWWVGLPLGILLAIGARAGSQNKLSFAQLQKPILILMVVSASAAFCAGLISATLIMLGIINIPGWWGEIIPSEKHVAFTAANGMDRLLPLRSSRSRLLGATRRSIPWIRTFLS